jgi:hypothetical protein
MNIDWLKGKGNKIKIVSDLQNVIYFCKGCTWNWRLNKIYIGFANQFKKLSLPSLK